MSRPGVGARPVQAVVMGPGGRRALLDGATGSVEIAFSAGAYVRLDTGRLLLAGPRAPLGPLSLLVARLPANGLRPGTGAAVDGDRLRVGGVDIAFGAARQPPSPRVRAPQPGWRQALAAALARIPPPPASLASGLRALARGELDAGTAALAGRGDGLTPSGDDVLAGYAAWRWTRGRPVTIDASRCSPLGRDYLRCGERGELPEPAAGVLAAVHDGDAPAASRRARRLTSWGASSGAALVWGMSAAAGPLDHG